ncbi:MAG: DUF333 domain-containing protein [Rhodospirillales bacterium]
MSKFIPIVILSSLMALTSCTSERPSRSLEPAKTAPLRLANPASTYCLEKGGQLFLEQDKDGARHGICIFEDNRQCEEWALFRDSCPIGGIKVTGYSSWEEKFCAIRGGKPFGPNCLLPEDINLSKAKLVNYRCSEKKGISIAWSEDTAILFSDQKKLSFRRAISASGARYTNDDKQLWSYREKVILSDGSDKSEQCVMTRD